MCQKHSVGVYLGSASSLSVTQTCEIKHITNSFSVTTAPAVINLCPPPFLIFSIALPMRRHRGASCTLSDIHWRLLSGEI